MVHSTTACKITIKPAWNRFCQIGHGEELWRKIVMHRISRQLIWMKPKVSTVMDWMASNDSLDPIEDSSVEIISSQCFSNAIKTLADKQLGQVDEFNGSTLLQLGPKQLTTDLVTKRTWVRNPPSFCYSFYVIVSYGPSLGPSQLYFVSHLNGSYEVLPRIKQAQLAQTWDKRIARKLNSLKSSA